MPTMKTVFGLFILANIFMFFGSLAMGKHDLALLNALSGMCCAMGYWIRREE